MTIITNRALNRALLERQMLLSRHDQPAGTALEQVVGLQAQAPLAPYVGLWSRLENFDPAELASLLQQREAVRMPLMRATIHLVSRQDAAALRPTMQAALARSFRASPFARRLRGLDLDQVLAAGRALLVSPLTRAELAHELGKHWLDHDPLALAYAVTYLLPVVQVPPRGIWGEQAAARWMAAEDWLGAQPSRHVSRECLVLRYLAAFGPATAQDAAVWSGLSGVGAVLESLRPRLRTFRSEEGVELFDVEGAPLPAPDTPAPPRYLPEYDNVLLSHANRSRVIEGDKKPPLPPGDGAMTGTVLIDGFMRATWKLERVADQARLVVDPFAELTQADADAVTAKGMKLLDFLTPEAPEPCVVLRQPVVLA